MALRHTLIIAPLLLAIAACETAQENPNYKYSSTYGNTAPQVLAANSRHPDQTQTSAPVRYVSTAPTTTTYNGNIVQTSAQTTSTTGTYTRVNHECLNRERTRTLIGAGLGGSAGAVAGNKLIGGTKGTLIGAAAGGVAGYGIGDKTIDCDPIQVQDPTQQAVITPAYNPSSYSTAPVQSQPYTTAASNQTYTPSLTENQYSSDTVGTPGYEALQQSQRAAAAPIGQYESYGSSTDQYGNYAQQTVPSVPPQPAQTVAAAVPPSIPAWPQAQSALGSHYQIKAGDTVYSLSRSLCTSVSNIQALNNLDQNFSIQAGQTLRLPSSEC